MLRCICSYISLFHCYGFLLSFTFPLVYPLLRGIWFLQNWCIHAAWESCTARREDIWDDGPCPFRKMVVTGRISAFCSSPVAGSSRSWDSRTSSSVSGSVRGRGCRAHWIKRAEVRALMSSLFFIIFLDGKTVLSRKHSWADRVWDRWMAHPGILSF